MGKNEKDKLEKKIDKINRRVRLIEGFLKWIDARMWKFFLRTVVRGKKRKSKKDEAVLKFIKRRSKKKL